MGKALRFVVGIATIVAVVTFLGFSWSKIGSAAGEALRNAFGILDFIKDLLQAV